MSATDVVSAVRSAGLQVAHMAWPENSAPALPWCVYYVYEDEPQFADDKRYANHWKWCVELYQRQDDGVTEEKLDAAIADAFGPYTKSEEWVESEGCIQTIYLFDQIQTIGGSDGY